MPGLGLALLGPRLRPRYPTLTSSPAPLPRLPAHS